jgi:inositol hexakisphosphate/diphosphoinositol-pentakisphosphate kinase
VHVLDRWEISGINRKLQLKPLAWETQGDVEVACELLLILKWGGELTSLGARQAMELGDSFRNSTYPDVGGGGLLRLHSTFRHDLKIKTSDEGRVMKTAAAFAKGFLELEGDLTPILVSLVHKERTSGMMLDHSGNKDIKKVLLLCCFALAVQLPDSLLLLLTLYSLGQDMDRCKDYIKQLMDIDRDLTDAEILTLVPAEQISVVGALKKLRNPKARLEELLKHIAAVVQQLERLVSLYGDVMDSRISDSEREKDCGDAELIYSHRAHAFSSSDDGDGHSDTDSVTSDPAIFSGMTGPPIKKATPHAPPPNVQRHPPLIPKRSLPKDPSRAARGETILLMLDRWRKLYKDLYNEKKGGFNVTKIPDVHDAARYDCLHNNHMNLTGMAELYNLSKACADCVVPQEYGIGSKDKLMIGSKMCSALMEKIKYDLIIARSDNEVDMRYNLDLRHAEVRTCAKFPSHLPIFGALLLNPSPLSSFRTCPSTLWDEECGRGSTSPARVTFTLY